MWKDGDDGFEKVGLEGVKGDILVMEVWKQGLSDR